MHRRAACDANQLRWTVGNRSCFNNEGFKSTFDDISTDVLGIERQIGVKKYLSGVKTLPRSAEKISACSRLRRALLRAASVGERQGSPSRGERFSIVKTLGSATGVHRLVRQSRHFLRYGTN